MRLCARLQSTLYLGNVDADAGSLMVRNGSIDPIALDGWVLKSLKTNIELKLPKISLGPGERGARLFSHLGAVLFCLVVFRF